MARRCDGLRLFAAHVVPPNSMAVRARRAPRVTLLALPGQNLLHLFQANGVQGISRTCQTIEELLDEPAAQNDGALGKTALLPHGNGEISDEISIGLRWKLGCLPAAQKTQPSPGGGSKPLARIIGLGRLDF